MPVPDSIKAYTTLGLRLYDRLIMHLVLEQIWGCASDRLIGHYRDHVTPNHADIGVGTGYCLDRCGFGFATPRLALIDLQPNCLDYTARRLARYRPATYVRDVTRPLARIPGDRFDSIALGGVLHCLAGDLRAKCTAFDNIASLGQPGTKVFGYGLVSDDVPRTVRRRLTHRLLNALRVIDNTRDHLSDLHRELAARFVDCRIEAIGCMALFSAVVPQRRS